LEVTRLNLTTEKVEQLAPDQASLSAALKLMRPGSWIVSPKVV
jgi:hypothetical protein